MGNVLCWQKRGLREISSAAEANKRHQNVLLGFLLKDQTAGNVFLGFC